MPAPLISGILAVFAISELLLSPIGLAVTTKLAPQAFRAQMMALYFFSVGLGTSMSGVLARYYDAPRGRLLRDPGPRRHHSAHQRSRVSRLMEGHRLTSEDFRDGRTTSLLRCPTIAQLAEAVDLKSTRVSVRVRPGALRCAHQRR